MQGGEMLPRCVTEPFSEVEDESMALRQPDEEVRGLGRLDVGDLRARVRQLDLARVLDVPDASAIELLDPVVAVEGDTLRRRDAGHQALGLDVPNHRLWQPQRLAED